MKDNGGQSFAALFYQAETDVKGNQGELLRHHKHMEKAAALSSLLDQIPVPQGERVGVDYHRPGNSFLRQTSARQLPYSLLLQPAKIRRKAVLSVLHKHHPLRDPGDLIKSQAFKKQGGGAFGIYKQV